MTKRAAAKKKVGFYVDQETRLAVLREMGEWMALGYYEMIDAPWPRGYGRAFRRLYENMEIVIPENRLLIPCEPLPRSLSRDTHDTWYATSLLLDFNHNSGLRLNIGNLRTVPGETYHLPTAKKKQFPQYAGFIDGMIDDLLNRLHYFGGYTHSNPDIRRVVTEGYDAMDAELDAQLADLQQRAELNKEDAEALQLLLAVKDYSIGVRTFHGRVSAALREAVAKTRGQRQRELALIADAFAGGFLKPARNYLEGLLAVNLAWMLDGCDSIGRFDQPLGPLFEKDMADGLLDANFARRLLDEVFQNFERFNGWNMQIGGYTPDGRDGTNALTIECIAACGRNHFRRPNVAFRITKDTPDTALADAVRALTRGSGRPALYNDDRYTETLFSMDLGLSREDSREIGFGGCTETMIAGLSNVGSLEGMLSFAKALELAMHDGYDPISKCQRGPHTGTFAEFATFDQFYAAVKRQIQYLTDGFVGMMNRELERRFHGGDPKIYRTFFTRDCIRNRQSFEAGGARYNWSVVSYQGIANLIDGLAAVRECVYEKKQVTPAQLLTALEANYAGYEGLRRMLLSAPKFGNDDPRADDLGREIIDFAWKELYSHTPPRGGRYLASCILFTTYYGAGLDVAATPDGRRAREVLTDSVGPAQGRDEHGPTAMLNSVAKLPLDLAVGTPVLNIRFLKSTLQEPAGINGVVSLVRGFFAKGGMQIQLSVIDKEEMLAAQREPEKHKDLIVRIGGYSEFFVILPKELQDSVIARTEHGL